MSTVGPPIVKVPSFPRGRTWSSSTPGERRRSGRGSGSAAPGRRWPRGRDRARRRPPRSRLGLAESPVRVKLDGGGVEVEWAGEGEPVFIEGPAEYVCEGEGADTAWIDFTPTQEATLARAFGERRWTGRTVVRRLPSRVGWLDGGPRTFHVEVDGQDVNSRLPANFRWRDLDALANVGFLPSVGEWLEPRRRVDRKDHLRARGTGS